MQKAADRSRPTAVELKVWMYRPISGSAQTLAANISPTVLPVSVPPQRCKKKGRQPSGPTSALAKEAASAIRAAIPSPARTSLATASQLSHSPRVRTLSKKGRKLWSPSKTSSST